MINVASRDAANQRHHTNLSFFCFFLVVSKLSLSLKSITSTVAGLLSALIALRRLGATELSCAYTGIQLLMPMQMFTVLIQT